MAAILGISAFYHDSAAALVVDGGSWPRPRRSGSLASSTTPAIPRQAIAYCPAGRRDSTPDDLDYVAFYDKPLTKFERLLETYLAYAPRGFRSFRLAMPLWLKEKLHMRRTLRHGLGGPTRARLVFTDHHESHAASAFFPVPVRRGRDPHARRRRRVDHDHLRHRRGQPDPPDRPHRSSRTRWACSTRPSPTTAASRSTAASTS